LHLDGLADVADALGAAHRSPERFIEVLRDPHIGAYGTMAIVLQLVAKLVLLAAIARPPALAAVVLIAAWARWGALVWGTFLPPLARGSGERFAWHIDKRGMVAEGLVLACSACGWLRCCWPPCSSLPALRPTGSTVWAASREIVSAPASR